MSDDYKFVNNSLLNEIYDSVLPSMYPILNKNHKDILFKYIVRLINIIALLFEFTVINEDGESTYGSDYEYQLRQNNYQDIKWLINHLLPFVNENGDLSKIRSFNDIYVQKKSEVDINTESPKYVYSNLQYNRFDRTVENFSERQFDQKDMEDNFCILIETLKTMSHKMHVNWVDILPFTLNDYKKSNLYLYTQSKILRTKKVNSKYYSQFEDWDPVQCLDFNIDDGKLCEQLSKKITGLQIEDIYNTISNDLYQSIKNIKWLIYDIYTTSNIYPMIVILGKFFNLEACLAQIEWEDFNGKLFFEQMWKNFISTAEKGGGVTYDSLIISNSALVTLLSGFILSFDKGASNDVKTDAENTGYIETPKSKEYLKKIGKLENSDEDDEDDEFNGLSFESLLISLKSLEPRYVYDFIGESLQKFKTTWYGTKLLTQDKKKVIDIENFKYLSKDKISSNTSNTGQNNLGDDNFVPLTYKNIYNFSKSFVHIVTKNGKPFIYPKGWEKLKGIFLKNILQDTEFIPLPTQWKSLDKYQKLEIIKRLNGGHDSVREWFNIARYVKHLAMDAGIIIKDDRINLVNEKIHDMMIRKLTDVIFEALIIKGVLTKFVPNKYKTNRNYVDRDNVHKLQGDVFRTDIDNNYWTSAYHYLTNIPYCEMEEFRVDTNPPTNRPFNYFSYGKIKDGDWYLIDAYNWVAQIGFCHHFINNRVQFITGAPGVGKSTEIPKLFLYYSKAISYIQNPKIICTEPRIEPTSSNASRIATCLGIPISVPVEGQTKEVQTNNYYIQTEYNGSDAHTKPVPHAMLKYATDGTLILQANNPLMKNNKIDEQTKNLKFRDVNTYDIIMIDEAHEHKINMDLLLTIFRHAVTYNNSLKLVILSATMDDDEPRYRRYFRDVNDNRKYPLNTWLKDSKIDRINVDRRYHISPPSTGTRYKVTEHYCPDKSEKEVVKEILSNSETGDILIFEPSAKKILSLVEELNKSTPPYVIALPYFSKMDRKEDEWKKKIIAKINEKLKTIKMNKNIPFSDPIVDRKYMVTGNNTYTRAIIVATNIAEASITLPSLKFVIDTGTQIVNKYDYRKRSDIQETIFISESSRIQRKGRVGRKSSGDVYYLYKKGSLESNTTEYEISTENLTLNLFGKLKQNNIETIIIDKNHDPNNPLNMVKYEDIKNYFDNFGLSKTIKNQYFLGNKYFDYFGNTNSYDYNNYESLAPFYQSGFDMCTLTDSRGKFYLIHPNELELKRNMAGQIVGKTNIVNNTNSATFTKDQKYFGYIKSKKIRSFWQMLLDYLYITFNDEKNDIIKTSIGVEIVKFFESLKLDYSFHGLVRAIVFGMSFGCKDEMLKLATFYMITSYNSLLITQPKINPLTGRPSYNSGESDEDSESIAVLNKLNKVHSWLNDNNISNGADGSNDIDYKSEHVLSKLSIIKKHNIMLSGNEMSILLGPSHLYTVELKKKISLYKTSRIVDELETELVFLKIEKLYEKITEFKKWCKINQFDGKILFEYVVKFFKFKNLIQRSITKEISVVIDVISNSFNKSSIFIERNINSVNLALIMGFPFNICKKINKSKYYLSLYNPNLDNIYLVSSMSKYKYKPMSLIKEVHLQNYILFLSLSSNLETEEDTLICVHKIDPKLFSILSHIYGSKEFKKITQNINVMNEIENLVKSKLDTQNMNLSNAIIGYTKTLNSITKDLSDYDDLRTIEFMKGFDQSLEKFLC